MSTAAVCQLFACGQAPLTAYSQRDIPTTKVCGQLGCKAPVPAGLTTVPLCSTQMYRSSYTAACRAALLAVYSAEALLLAFALKLKVSAATAGEGRPALNSARPFRGGASAAQWDRAAGFLGSCMPRMQPLRGSGKPLQGSGFKVGRVKPPCLGRIRHSISASQGKLLHLARAKLNRL